MHHAGLRGLAGLDVGVPPKACCDIWVLAAKHHPLICVIRSKEPDWDESHVDVPDLDLVLPHNVVRALVETGGIAAPHGGRRLLGRRVRKARPLPARGQWVH
jgi:hypothetical protein